MNRNRPVEYKPRHELYGHPKPVLTCPMCILVIAGRLLNERSR